MWLPEPVITTIGGFLPFKDLARFYLASTKTKKALLKDFIARSHPAVIDYIGNRIMEEREAEPCQPYTMLVRDAQLIRFENLDEDKTGWLTFFSTALSDDENSLEVRTSYIFSEEEEVNSVEAMIKVTITPSKENPTKNVTVVIKREYNIWSTTTLEYTDGFNPRLALEWCPVVVPNLSD